MSDDYWERTKHSPNMKRDALYVVRSGGNDAGKFLWGGLGLLFAFFWPLEIHGTGRIVAMAAWWGFLGIVAIIAAAAQLGYRPARRSRPPRGRLNVEAGPASGYVPPQPYIPPQPPGPDPGITARLLLDLDRTDAYIGEIDRAWSDEALDYLQAHGELPGGWPFPGSREGWPS